MKFKRIHIFGVGTIEVGQLFRDPLDNVMIVVSSIITDSVIDSSLPKSGIKIEGHDINDKSKIIIRYLYGVPFITSPADVTKHKD